MLMLLLIGCNCTSFRVLLLDIFVDQYVYLKSAIFQCMLIPDLLIFFNFWRRFHEKKFLSVSGIWFRRSSE
jgi:hypothetical protein